MEYNNIKKEFINNIIVQMSGHLEKDELYIMEQVITAELSRVHMDGIPTLPKLYRDSVDQGNQHIIQLFLCKTRIKPKTAEAYLHSVKRLLGRVHKPITHMETSDISYYLYWYNTHPRETEPQASTYNNERRFLSAFFTWMRKEKMILENPVESIDPHKVIRKPIDYFEAEEMIRIRDACKNIRERALIEVLRSTGARVGELVEITTSQVDWNTGDILILSEKSDRYRTIYLDDEAKYYLREYLKARKEKSQYLFPRSRAPYNQMATGGVRSILREIGKRAGVECRVYPHKMRKTLGMRLKNRDIDIGIIQEIMGHADPVVTARYYAQSTPETLRNIRRRVG